jgi:hypothetical protein
MRDQDTIVFKIERERPIALERLTYGMMALGAEYERFFRRVHPKSEPQEADLLVQRITEKCIWIELIGAAAPILQGMDNILIFKEFVNWIGTRIGSLSVSGGRLEDANAKELDSLARLAGTIVADKNGEAEMLAIEYTSETKDKKVVAKISYKSKDAETIIFNARRQIKEITGKDANLHNKVLMRFFQTNIGDAKADKPTGEKVIIESITEAPRRVVYASEIAGQKIKSVWADKGQNPYELGFIVDVNVEEVNGKPRLYRITDVYDIFRLDEDDD